MRIPDLYKLFLQYPSIQTDTRKLKKGDIFFALKGPNFNANKFALDALSAGAALVVIDEAIALEDPRIILVADVLTSLQELAKYHRQQFTIPFIAITGSNGKTTSKELIFAVLSSHFKAYTTQGNLNNHIGVPLTILSVKPDAEIAVIEMGANHLHEIESYCRYTLPTHGIITNCGKAHLEGFGGMDGVKKGKGELFSFLRENSGTAFVYTDYDYLKKMSKGIREIITYGTKDGWMMGKITKNEPFVEVTITKGIDNYSIQTQLVGDYNLPNILCAAVIGKYFGVPDKKIQSAIENYSPSNSRSQLIQIGSNTIILDAYNANPTSMKAAIENFAGLPASHKVLMLGGMMELGKESREEHKAILDLIKQYKWSKVVLVGGDFGNIKHDFIYFPNSLAAKEWFNQQKFLHTHLLIKGSRSMQMEKIL